MAKKYKDDDLREIAKGIYKEPSRKSNQGGGGENLSWIWIVIFILAIMGFLGKII